MCCKTVKSIIQCWAWLGVRIFRKFLDGYLDIWVYLFLGVAIRSGEARWPSKKLTHRRFKLSFIWDIVFALSIPQTRIVPSIFQHRTKLYSYIGLARVLHSVLATKYVTIITSLSQLTTSKSNFTSSRIILSTTIFPSWKVLDFFCHVTHQFYFIN